MREFCPVCRSKTSYMPDVKKSTINCPRCGKFYYSGLLDEELLLDDRKITLLSGFLRDNPEFCITQKNLNDVINNIIMPSVGEKADRILLALKELSATHSERLYFGKDDPEYHMICGKSYINDFNEWKSIVYRHLRDNLKYIDANSVNDILITIPGWIYIEEEIIGNKYDDTQRLFKKGEIFDAYKDVSNIVKSANSSIILIDNYIDENVLTLLSKSNKNVKIIIYTLKISDQLKLDIDKFEQQYGKIEVNLSKDYHDRFLIIDNVKGYHIGASIKDMGKSVFTYSELEPENTRKLIESISDRDPEPSSG